jgi:hypothetical protein
MNNSWFETAQERLLTMRDVLSVPALAFPGLEP